MNRRDFIRAAAASVAAVPFSSAANPLKTSGGKSEEFASADNFEVPPFAQIMGSDSIAVSWVTRQPSTGYIEWAISPSETNPSLMLPKSAVKRVWTTRGGLRDANSKFHSAVICGVDFSRTISVVAISRPIASFGAYKVTYAGPEQKCKFALKPLAKSDGSVSFVMLNDTHGNMSVFKSLPAIISGSSAPSFALLNGDIISSCDNCNQIRESILASMANITNYGLSNFYLRGNHELRGHWARRLSDELAMPDGHFYGAATIGCTRFIFLDCGEDKEDSHWAYSGLNDFDSYIADEMAPWLSAELAKKDWTNAEKRIVAIHIPPKYTDDDWQPPKRLDDHIYSQLKNAGVSLLVGGHVHRWSIEKPIMRAPYPVVIGGGPGGSEVSTMTLVNVTRRDISVRVTDTNGKTLGELAV